MVRAIYPRHTNIIFLEAKNGRIFCLQEKNISHFQIQSIFQIFAALSSPGTTAVLALFMRRERIQQVPPSKRFLSEKQQKHYLKINSFLVFLLDYSLINAAILSSHNLSVGNHNMETNPIKFYKGQQIAILLAQHQLEPSRKNPHHDQIYFQRNLMKAFFSLEFWSAFELNLPVMLFVLPQMKENQIATLRMINNIIHLLTRGKVDILLQQRIFDLAFGLLFHKSADIRKQSVTTISNTSLIQKSQFLKQTAMIEKLLKMLKSDQLQIKKRVLSLLIWFKEDAIKKVKFWVKINIIEHIENMILTTESQEDLEEILQDLNDLLQLSWVEGSNCIRKRVEKSLIPQRLDELKELEVWGLRQLRSILWNE